MNHKPLFSKNMVDSSDLLRDCKRGGILQVTVFEVLGSTSVLVSRSSVKRIAFDPEVKDFESHYCYGRLHTRKLYVLGQCK